MLWVWRRCSGVRCWVAAAVPAAGLVVGCCANDTLWRQVVDPSRGEARAVACSSGLPEFADECVVGVIGFEHVGGDNEPISGPHGAAIRATTGRQFFRTVPAKPGFLST